MILLVKHIRAFLLSAAVIVTFVKLKTAKSGAEKLRSPNNHSNYNYTDVLEEDVAKNRKKYRNFILNERSSNNQTDVYILGLFELTTDAGVRREGFSEVSAAQLAVDHVNERNLLNGYRMRLLINDTQCDPGAGIDRFFHALYSKKTIAMLLGSGCSNVTESLASIVPYWNILQVSFGSRAPTLSDRNKFPLFFRTVAPDSSLNNARAAFIRHFMWDTVATFSQRDNNYLLPLNDLVVRLEKSQIGCAAAVTFSSDNIREQLEYLKDLDIRVIVGSFSASIAPKIFCEVYGLKMFGRDYVWILQEEQQVTWWRSGGARCNQEELKRAIESAIFLSSHDVIPSDRASISGLTNVGFLRGLNITPVSPHARQTYDAVWTMALILSQIQDGHSLGDFYYDNDEFVEDLMKRISELRFMGVSGPVRFEGADRVGNSIIRQIQGGVLKTVAIYYSENGSLNFHCASCEAVRWPGNSVPIARRIVETKLQTIPPAPFYAILTISALGILTCLIFLYFNFHYRALKVVKLSSPKLNNIAVLGCVLVYTAIILLGMDMESIGYFSQMCTIKVYIFSGGFTLAFGSMFAKTYRVHRIFTYSCTSLVKDKILKDKQLIGLILGLLLVDGVIVVFWVCIDPLQRELYNLTKEISSEDRSIIYQPQVEVCRCNNTSGWFVAMYGYKGFLLIMGVYMAWETRHIKVEPLNDSQYIGICVYSAVFTSIIVLLSNFLADYTILAYLARSVSILVSATLTLLLLFVPKLKAVFWDKEHDPIMQSMGLKFECNTRRLLVDDPRELTYRMEVQNRVYRCELEALDREIARLEAVLAEDRPKSYTQSSRASWPSTSFYTTRNNFLSDSTLNMGERVRIIDRMKNFFGRIPSVWLHFSNNAVSANDGGDSLSKARSMNLVSGKDSSSNRPFFISVDDSTIHSFFDDPSEPGKQPNNQQL